MDENKGKKIVLTVITIVGAIFILAFLNSGIQFGNPFGGMGIQLPEIHPSITVKADIVRGFYDLKISDSTIEISHNFFSIGKLGVFDFAVPNKQVVLKMRINGASCDEEKRMEFTGLSTERVTLNCKANKGSNVVNLELYDTEGLEDSYETTYFIK